MSKPELPVRFANDAGVLLADLPTDIPPRLSFWSLFELTHGMATLAALQQVLRKGHHFTAMCRLRPAAERAPSCGSAASLAGPLGDSAATLERRHSADWAVIQRSSAAEGVPRLGPVADHQPAAAAGLTGPSAAGQPAFLSGRASLDSALAALQRKPSAPDQMFAVSFAPCPGAAAAQAPPAPAYWFATLRPCSSPGAPPHSVGGPALCRKACALARAAPAQTAAGALPGRQPSLQRPARG